MKASEEIKKVRAELREMQTAWMADIKEIARLKAENERLRADAERLDWLEAHPRLGEIHVDGEVKDCYLYAVSGALGAPLRAIIDAAMKDFSTTTKEE